MELFLLSSSHSQSSSISPHCTPPRIFVHHMFSGTFAMSDFCEQHDCIFASCFLLSLVYVKLCAYQPQSAALRFFLFFLFLDASFCRRYGNGWPPQGNDASLREKRQTCAPWRYSSSSNDHTQIRVHQRVQSYATFCLESKMRNMIKHTHTEKH